MKGSRWAFLLLFLILALAVVAWKLPQDESSNPNYHCSLTSQVKYVPGTPGADVERYLENGSILIFSEMPGVWPAEGNGTMRIAPWATEMGISPPCAIQKSEVLVTLNGRGSTWHVGMLKWKCENSSEPKCGIISQSSHRDSVPAGEVRMAYYLIPTGEGRWFLRDYPLCGNETDFEKVCGYPPVPKWFNGTCNCSLENVIRATEGKIRDAGFREASEVEPPEGDILLGLYSRLYRRGDEYLYVEFAEVRGMNLARVLMIMGDEEVVKAYAKAFTAVEENGSGES
ncbi:hypothetical protein [Thermococcus aciditolerans]|uniref:Uncharacterized protein n=1 Tax=Thermococcus aciditolerans TaxID=2598455 RepID=A0A5C0SM69_9EURY|nr:hypothetical protein [Thermococcus aciditolerans]QEK15493.1 hypothetical protein FPV09_10810 [Thermococcus aciditolerans]